VEDYRTIRGTAIGEYEEKKSRFIAQLSFADSEEKAVAFLEQVRAANRTPPPPATTSMPTVCGRAAGSATPTTANRPRRRGRLRWRSCSTAA